MHTITDTLRIDKSLDRSEMFFYALLNTSGQFLHGNSFLRRTVEHLVPSLQGAYAIQIIRLEDHARLDATLGAIISQPGITLQTELTLKCQENNCTTKWEFIYFPAANGGHEYIQAVGVRLPESSLPERYRAYEMGTEGLWRFELKNPIPVNTPADQMVLHFRNDGYLGECNDSMAKMYGFSKAADLLGMKLDDLMDLKDPARIENLVNFVRDGFVAKDFETKEYDRDGNILYFLNNMTGVVENGRLVRVWGTQRNITEQRIAEQNMRKSELFYRNLIMDSLDGILLTDEKGVISFASPSVTKVLGYQPSEVVGRMMFDFVHPEDIEEAVQRFSEEIKMEPDVKYISIRLLRKDGNWTWCIVRGHNMLHNPYIGKVGIYFYDDTIRKQTEKALSDSERKLRTQATILNSVTDMIVTTDLNLKITSWNKVAEELTGVKEEDILGRPAEEVISYDFSSLTEDQVRNIIFDKGIWKGELHYSLPGDRKLYLMYTISILKDEEGRHIGLLAVGKDITERKQAEEKLTASEEFFRNLISLSLDGILLTDANGVINYCGLSVKTLTGYEPADIVGRNIFDFVHPEDKGPATEAFMLELNNASVMGYILVRIRNAEGQWLWCSARSHNLLDSPPFHAMAIYFTDESRRKEMEGLVIKSEQQFRSLIYNIKQGIILLNPQRTTIICNDAAATMLGLTEKQIRGLEPFDPRWNVIREDGRDFPLNEQPYAVALETKKSVRDVVLGVYRPQTSDRVWLLVNAEPILNENNELMNVICSYTDISEQKRLSQELIEQEIQKQMQLTQATIDGQEKERQEIGKELHDNINQHLNTTRLYLEVALEKADGEILEMISLAHKNLTSIVNEIRQLSQSLVPPTLGDLGLVESIQELCDSLKRAHTFNVDFMFRHFEEDGLPENLKLMLFRIAQEQVNNIVRHAHATSIQIKLQKDAEHLILTIHDDGVGFDLHHYKKGLGFKNIASRAALFNGEVEIDTSAGKGCTVTVTIPLITES